MKFNWGTGIFIFLIIFVSLAITFIIFSLQFDTNLVHKDYYEKGLDYDNEIAIAERSKQFADAITVTDENNTVVIEFEENIAKEIETCNIYFFKISDRHQDYQKDYKLIENKIIIDHSNLAKGKYDLRISWKNGGDIFMVEKLYVAP